jgi:hypothetical protein
MIGQNVLNVRGKMGEIECVALMEPSSIIGHRFDV